MKKGVVFCFVFLFLIVAIFPFVSSALNSTQEQTQVSKAYTCLENKVNTTAKCSSLSTEEKIFTVMSTGLCSSELQADSSNNNECWPSGKCSIKTTAQAILALDKVGVDTSKAVDWLLAQKKPTTEISWFLEVESPGATSCTVDYAAGSFDFNIGEDKKISSDAGLCLTRAQDDYWLRISPSCFDESFDVSCDKNFLTTLVFQKPDSSTVHVSPDSSTASAGGTTSESVESFCFTENNICNYDGTLWAATVLNSKGKDVSDTLPYLTSLAEDNKPYSPDVFLYFITGSPEQSSSILSRQKSKKWWLESGDKLYDTALALLPFQQDTLQQKDDTKEWLISTQDSNGCWQNNVRDTAFILASIWPNSNLFHGGSSGIGAGSTSCTSAGYYCTSGTSSCTGQILSGFSCSSSLYSCCSVAPIQQTCNDFGGVVCSSSQVCNGGTEISASGLNLGESCCVSGGACINSQTAPAGGSACEASGGVCRSFGCNTGEQQSDSLTCSFSGDSCCIAPTTKSGSLLWVWILLILIILVVLGIIFREKLRMLWLRISKKKPTSGSSSNSFGNGRPYTPPQIFQPRIFPTSRPQPRPMSTMSSRPSPRPVARPRPKSSAQKELDEVLKKLKDMNK